MYNVHYSIVKESNADSSANHLYQVLMRDFLNFDSKCKIALQETKKKYI